MRKLLLLFFLVAGAFTIQAQETNNDQWTLITKKTADWCPYCGQWGWDFKENLLNELDDENIVFWAAHHSGGLATETAKALIKNMPSSGQPVFYIGTDNMNVSGGNANSKLGEFKTVVETLNLLEPFAGVGSKAVYDGEKITSTAKVKFLVDLENGDYWLASYLIDKKLVANQSGQGSNAEHTNVLLHSLNNTDYFGKQVSAGTPIAAETEFTVEGTLNLPNSNNISDFIEGFDVVTILWTKVDGKFTVFNLNQQRIEESTSTKNLLNNVEINAFYSRGNNLEMGITSDITLNNASIAVYDINGRMVTNNTNVNITSGKNQLSIATPILPLGTYVVRIQSEEGSRSIKITTI